MSKKIGCAIFMLACQGWCEPVTNPASVDANESPLMLYVVPWNSGTPTQNTNKLTLPDVFGDLFDPLTPSNYNDSLKPITGN